MAGEISEVSGMIEVGDRFPLNSAQVVGFTLPATALESSGSGPMAPAERSPRTIPGGGGPGLFSAHRQAHQGVASIPARRRRTACDTGRIREPPAHIRAGASQRRVRRSRPHGRLIDVALASDQRPTRTLLPPSSGSGAPGGTATDGHGGSRLHLRLVPGDGACGHERERQRRHGRARVMAADH